MQSEDRGRTLRGAVWLAALLLLMPACGEAEPPADELDARTAPPAQEAPAPAVREARRGQNVEQRLEDASTATRVRIALADSLKLYGVEPVVVDGRVRLEGEFASADVRQRAVRVAERVEGVRAVVDELPPPGTGEAVADAGRPTLPPGTGEQDVDPRPPVDVPTESPTVADAAPTAGPEERPSAGGNEADAEQEKKREEPQEVYHRVQSGESLWIIARKYDTSITRIKRLNNMRSDRIRPGQQLRVK